MAAGKLTFNERNCVIMRRGEKEVLQFYVDLARECIPKLNEQWKVRGVLVSMMLFCPLLF